LIAANYSFIVGLPLSQRDGSRSPSPPLPRDRCHALPLRVVLSERAQGADGPRRCRRCRRPRASVHGTYRGRFAAHEGPVPLQGFGHWNSTRWTGRNARNRTEHGRGSG
jgi:hypothetical protein